MTGTLRCSLLVVGPILALACGTEQPTAPSSGLSSAPITPPAAPMPTPPSQPVPAGQPVATYVFSGPLDYPIGGATSRSQYLLYGNGVFGLQYDVIAHVFLGTYEQEHATVSFRFYGQGDAAGTLKGDLLEVRYSEIMQHSDFENAVYRLSR